MVRFLFLFLAMVSVSRADYQVWSEWRNALAPQGSPSEPLQITQDGQTNFAIVIPAAALSQDVKAANDLRTWLLEMTGTSIPVVNEPNTAGTPHVISVGRTIRLAAANIPAAAEDLGDEGYGIDVRNGDLFLWGGRTRGAINAVYAFLEEDLGCRWYTIDHRRIPSVANLACSPVPRTYRPPLQIRDPFYFVSFNEDWSIRNRTNAPWAIVREEWGGRTDYGYLFAHTLLSLVPPSQYYASHPEYYMMNASGNRVTTQLCTTNEDIRQIVTQNVRQFLIANPHTEIVDISKMDTTSTCLCPVCQAADQAEGSGMGSLLPLVNHVAQQIEADYPDVQVTTLAYFDTLQPPRTLRPRHNVVIRLCNTESWSAPFLPMEQTSFGTLLQSWAAVHNRISIWDYNVNFYHYPAPMPNMEVIGKDIPFMVANNVTDIMTQGGYQCTSERDTMRSWVIAKLMWDPSRDWFEMQQDFTWGHFGNAAAKIAEYNELLRNQGILYAKQLKRPPGGIRFAMDSVFLTPEFLTAANAILDQAETQADNEQVLHRVQRERLPIWYVQLERGPDFVGMSYGPTLERFETVARREGVDRVSEGKPDLEPKLEAYRAAWNHYAHVPQGVAPATGAIDLLALTPLSWSVRDGGNCSYRIYFGDTNPPEFRGTSDQPSFNPGRLSPFTVWYWRVETVWEGKTFAGPTWQFKTRRHADYDGDADVDQDDYALLQACMSGPAAPQTDPACANRFLDSDNDIDADDVAVFLRCMSSPGTAADLQCAPGTTPP